MCVCVCVYIRIYIHIYIYIYSVCVCVCACVRVHTRTHTHTLCTRTHAHTHTCVCERVVSICLLTPPSRALSNETRKHLMIHLMRHLIMFERVCCLLVLDSVTSSIIRCVSFRVLVNYFKRRKNKRTQTVTTMMSSSFGTPVMAGRSAGAPVQQAGQVSVQACVVDRCQSRLVSTRGGRRNTRRQERNCLRAQKQNTVHMGVVIRCVSGCADGCGGACLVFVQLSDVC